MNKELDKKIKAALETECRHISASDLLKQKIDRELFGESQAESREGIEGFPGHLQKEEHIMSKEGKKVVSVKKMVIGIAAACLLVSGVCFAGKTAYLMTSGIGYSEWDSYEDIDEMEEKLGLEVDSVETFANGYSFTGAYVETIKAMDENDNKLYDFKELTLQYEKEGAKDLNLYMHRVLDEGETAKTPDLTRTVTLEDGTEIMVRYDIYTYKFVPVDYEMTEEDRENEARDDYYISEGSEEVEIQQYSGVVWEKGGVYYHLMGFDVELGGEEMLDMAEEIITK